MKKLIYLFVFILALSACTDEQGARKTLERNGYKVVEVGGYDLFSDCKDPYQTKFKAIAPNGEAVTGTVTKGILKGSVIRLDD